MRASMSYALVFSLILAPAAYTKKDEIDFDPVPLVTVPLEPETRAQESYFYSIVAISGLSIIALSLLLCRR